MAHAQLHADMAGGGAKSSLSDASSQPPRGKGFSSGPPPGSRSRTVEPLPKEVIDYDNGLPLLAEPGTDRRRQTPDSVRQAVRETWGDTSIPEPEVPTPSKSALKDLWNQAVDLPSDASPQEQLASAVESRSSRDQLAAESGLNPLDPPSQEPPRQEPPSPEPPSPLEPAVEKSSGAEDLRHFLDFTPARSVESGSLSGPSFLGLSGDAEPPEAESEVEPRPRRWPRYAFLSVVVAVAVLTVMHGTALRDTASRYARTGAHTASRYAQVGVTYAHSLEKDLAGSSVSHTGPLVEKDPAVSVVNSTGPSSASPGPASDQAAAPDFTVEQRPAKPAAPPAETAGASETKATPQPPAMASPQAPTSPAQAAQSQPAASAALNPETKTESNRSPTPQAAPPQSQPKDQAAAPKPPATAKGRSAASKPSAQQQTPKPVAGQGEYQQALAATNPDVARALLWRATALGNSDAQVSLADMYIYGQGVPPNCEQGLVLLRAAAQKANPRAQGKMGALYATGKCVSPDRVQAYRWLTRALANNQGSEWTAKNRDMVWRAMSPEERSKVATMISTR
jgi:TPR repeat protein